MEPKKAKHCVKQEIKKLGSLTKEKDNKGISTNYLIKAEVFVRLGFPIPDIADRFGVEKKDLRAALKRFKPQEEAIRKVTDSVIETIASELKTGFCTEIQAIDDIYYWGVNKLRIKLQYDKNLSIRDIKDVTEFAYKIRQGDPMDDTIKAFFTTIENKQEIINMAEATEKAEAKEKADDRPTESGTGAKTSSRPETHSK